MFCVLFVFVTVCGLFDFNKFYVLFIFTLPMFAPSEYRAKEMLLSVLFGR